MGFLFWGFLFVVTCPFSISSLVCRCCFEGDEKRRGNLKAEEITPPKLKKMPSHATNTLKRWVSLAASSRIKISKRVKKARKHSKGELGGLCDEEFVDINKSRRTTKEKLECTFFGDDEGIHVYRYVELDL